MNLKSVALAALFLLVVAVSPAMAQTGESPFSSAWLSAGVGAGLALIGAGIGFGLIGYSTLQSMARQPEVAGRVQTAMLIIAALLEGATFFALIICILLTIKG